jgi:ABC-type transport system substrate-binding protein
MPRKASIRRLAPLLFISLIAIAGCTTPAPPGTVVRWVVGQAPPAFDPDGPPDVVAGTFLRLLGRGLVAIDSTGDVVPDAAERFDVSPDERRVTFHLHALKFADGTPCTSDDFRRALRAALARRDHSTARWLLSSIEGVEAIRSGRPLPSGLGIDAPDPRTLVVRLTRPDPRLLERLAIPGLAMPWKDGAGDGDRGWDSGIGRYRRIEAAPGRWTLVRARNGASAPSLEKNAVPGPELADTVRIRFALGSARIHSLIRQGAVDLAWPLPPGMLGLPPTAGYRLDSRPARPERWLLLVMRADLPPTSRPAARHALSHGLDRKDVLARLGVRATEAGEWIPGGGPFAFPARDAEEVRGWLARGKLGRSLHVTLGYAADREGGEVARAIQSEWARFALDAELQPLRGEKLRDSRLAPVGPHVQLVEYQPLLEDPEATLAGFVMPVRDPAVGAVRTGWRTREFDPWIGPRRSADPFDPEAVQRRLAEDRVVLPLARLPWLWIERGAGPLVAVDPRFGPQPERLRKLPVRPR